MATLVESQKRTLEAEQRIESLQPDGAYARVSARPSFPMISLDEIVEWVRLGDEMGDHNS